MLLRLRVENVKALYPARKSHAAITANGGIIGSAPDADWSVQDHSESLPETVGKIEYENGQFVFTAFPGADVFVNSSKSRLRANKRVLLNHKDLISFGDLNCRVSIGNGEESVIIYDEDQTIDSLASSRDQLVEDLVHDGELIEAKDIRENEKYADDFDPIHQFQDTNEEMTKMDPLKALDDVRRSKKSKQSFDDDLNVEGPRGTIPDYGDKQIAAIEAKHVRVDEYGFEETDANASPKGGYEFYYSDPPVEGDVDIETLRLLGLSLGAPFHDILPKDAPLVLSDIGQSLNRAVAGLSRILSSQNQNNRFPLASMHIHAIEDNPLRFSNSTEEALDTMFVNRGQVHLAPAAAIEESLEHLEQHHIATEYAIETALDAVMHAMRPQSLEKRFYRYARGKTPSDPTERDAWKWQMFEAYIAELTSTRQSGLKRLFWEVFANAYQDKMREFELHPVEKAGE